MATCDPQTLMASAACFECLPIGTLSVLQTQLLANILLALDPTANVTPQALMANAACFACLPGGLLPILQAQLLCEINSKL